MCRSKAYRFWSDISCFSTLSRRSRSLGLFCRIPLKSTLLFWKEEYVESEFEWHATFNWLYSLYCIWSFISAFSNLNRSSSSLGLFYHVSVEKRPIDWAQCLVFRSHMCSLSSTWCRWRLYILRTLVSQKGPMRFSAMFSVQITHVFSLFYLMSLKTDIILSKETNEIQRNV